MIVKLVSDLARLRLEGSELCALIEPLGDVPNLLTSDKRVKTGLSELTTRRQDPIYRLRFDLKYDLCACHWCTDDRSTSFKNAPT